MRTVLLLLTLSLLHHIFTFFLFRSSLFRLKVIVGRSGLIDRSQIRHMRTVLLLLTLSLLRCMGFLLPAWVESSSRFSHRAKTQPINDCDKPLGVCLLPRHPVHIRRVIDDFMPKNIKPGNVRQDWVQTQRWRDRFQRLFPGERFCGDLSQWGPVFHTFHKLELFHFNVDVAMQKHFLLIFCCVSAIRWTPLPNNKIRFNCQLHPFGTASIIPASFFRH